jgi:polyisoprenoid-binding protein YceI
VTRYTVDTDRSEVTVYASSSLHGITGHADGLRGWVDLDDTAIVGARIELDAERLAWGNPVLDRETRRRIDAARHPTIVGTMTGVDSSEIPSAEPIPPPRWNAQPPLRSLSVPTQLRGTIAFHGVEQEVSGVVTITDADADELVIEGEQTFDVRDWDLEPPRLLMLKVNPDIRVAIRVRAVR